jgi:hypothetical protein
MPGSQDRSGTTQQIQYVDSCGDMAFLQAPKMKLPQGSRKCGGEIV